MSVQTSCVTNRKKQGVGLSAVTTLMTILALGGSTGFAQFAQPAPVQFENSGPLDEHGNGPDSALKAGAEAMAESFRAELFSEAIDHGMKCLNHPDFDKLPDEEKSLILAGICISYNETGHPQMAAHLSTLYATIYPDQPLPHLIRADALKTMNQRRAEREALTTALSLAPDQLQIRIRLARALAEWPGSTQADGRSALRVLMPIVLDASEKHDSVEFHDAMAIAAAIAGEKSIAQTAAMNAVDKSDDQGRDERKERQRKIEADQPLQPEMTPPTSCLNPANASETLSNSVLILSLEGSVRFEPKDESSQVRYFKLTREYPAVLVGPLGLILASSRIIELPHDTYPDYRLSWDSPPSIRVSKRDVDSGELTESGTASVHAYSSEDGLAVLKLKTDADYDRQTGLVGWTPVTIAPDFRFERMLLTPEENPRLYVVDFDPATRRSEVQKLSIDEARDLINKGDLLPGTPVFDDSGELVMMTTPTKDPESVDPSGGQSVPPIIHADQCSLVYNCLSTYGGVPSRRLPFDAKIAALSGDANDSAGFSLEVLSVSKECDLEPGDIIVSFRSIPLKTPGTLEEILRVAHESFVEEIDVQLKDGRSVTIPLLPCDLAKISVNTLPSKEAARDTESVQTRLSQWVTENIRGADAIEAVNGQFAIAVEEGRGLRCLIGSTFNIAERPIVLFERSGQVITHFVDSRTANLMGISPNALLVTRVSKDLPRTEAFFSIEELTVKAVHRSDNESSARKRVLEVTFSIKRLKSDESGNQTALRIETGNGSVQQLFDLPNLPAVGESESLRVEITEEDSDGGLPDVEYLFLEICSFDGKQLSICSDSVFQVFAFEE